MGKQFCGLGFLAAIAYFTCAVAEPATNNTSPSPAGVRVDINVSPGAPNSAEELAEIVNPTEQSNRNGSHRSLQYSSPSSMPPSSSPSRGEVMLGFAAREIGVLECTGIDHLTGGKFFERMMGPGADASGNYLCQPTCGGDCVPNQHIGVAPRSLYPFGCRCNADRCDADGPKVTHFGSGRFKIICTRDTRCTCDGMSSTGVSHVGYLCNWINLNTRRVVSYRPRLNPRFSPIRWCSCCPQTKIF